MLHTDPGFPMTIGADCTIGHHAILHGCTIGENSLIGMGATVLNGARIGAEQPRRRERARHRRQGVPGQFADRRRAGEGDPHARRAAVERLRRTALHYVRNWQRFAEAGCERID